MSPVSNIAGVDSKTDATRAELERAATVQRGAQGHHDDLLLRHTAAVEALGAAKRARKVAKTELARAEKAVAAEQAAAESLGEQVNSPVSSWRGLMRMSAWLSVGTPRC